MRKDRRGRVLAFLAVSFGVLSVSNLLKPLGLEGSTTGFVFFGQRLSGTANLVAGPLFGILLGVYAWGIWNLKRIALPIGYAYAAYVVANLLLYPRFQSVLDGPGGSVGYVLYGAIAVGASIGCAVLLRRRKAELT
jgi:hypothetical protein